jgi:anthranilate synthase component 1
VQNLFHAFKEMRMSSAFIQTFTQNVPYHSDPTAIFATLCENKPNTLLLESAEISSKNSLSLLLVNAAMKISCLGQTVTFHALTDNGAAVLPLIAQKLSAQVNVTSQTSSELQVEFKPVDNNADEDSKLLAHSIFDGLRCFTDLYQASSLPVFLGYSPMTWWQISFRWKISLCKMMALPALIIAFI